MCSQQGKGSLSRYKFQTPVAEMVHSLRLAMEATFSMPPVIHKVLEASRTAACMEGYTSRIHWRFAGFLVFDGLALPQRRITVPRLYRSLHTHSGPHRLWSVLPAPDFLARRMAVSEGATLHHPVNRLWRIHLPRTRVNEPAHTPEQPLATVGSP
jgi:hypothetical protein